MKLVTISHTGRAEGGKKEDTTDQICTAMVMAESLNVANGEQETDSSSFQLPPVKRNEDILFSGTDFDKQCIVRVGHKAEKVYNMLIVTRTI